jgi:hypothetical protein
MRTQRLTRAQQEVSDRWDRIYNEKFADPDYYTRPGRVRLAGSSLGDPIRPGRSDRRDTSSGGE